MLFVLLIAGASALSCSTSLCYFPCASSLDALATIHSADDNAACSREAVNNGVTFATAGACSSFQSTCEWQDGSSFGYFPTGFNQQADGVIGVTANGNWVLLPFQNYDSFVFLCQVATAPVTASSVPTTLSPPAPSSATPQSSPGPSNVPATNLPPPGTPSSSPQTVVTTIGTNGTSAVPSGGTASPNANLTSSPQTTASPSNTNVTTTSSVPAPNATVPNATTIPSTTMPNATSPNATSPNGTAPNGTAPNATTIPSTTKPNATAPNGTVPNATAIPSTTMPNTTSPNATSPNGTAPNATAPNSTVIASTAAPTQAPPTVLNLLSIFLVVLRNLNLSASMFSASLVPVPVSDVSPYQSAAVQGFVPLIDIGCNGAILTTVAVSSGMLGFSVPSPVFDAADLLSQSSVYSLCLVGVLGNITSNASLGSSLTVVPTIQGLLLRNISIAVFADEPTSSNITKVIPGVMATDVVSASAALSFQFFAVQTAVSQGAPCSGGSQVSSFVAGSTWALQFTPAQLQNAASICVSRANTSSISVGQIARAVFSATSDVTTIIGTSVFKVIVTGLRRSSTTGGIISVFVSTSSACNVNSQAVPGTAMTASVVTSDFMTLVDGSPLTLLVSAQCDFGTAAAAICVRNTQNNATTTILGGNGKRISLRAIYVPPVTPQPSAVFFRTASGFLQLSDYLTSSQSAQDGLQFVSVQKNIPTLTAAFIVPLSNASSAPTGTKIAICQQGTQANWILIAVTNGLATIPMMSSVVENSAIFCSTAGQYLRVDVQLLDLGTDIASIGNLVAGSGISMPFWHTGNAAGDSVAIALRTTRSQTISEGIALASQTCATPVGKYTFGVIGADGTAIASIPPLFGSYRVCIGVTLGNSSVLADAGVIFMVSMLSTQWSSWLTTAGISGGTWRLSSLFSVCGASSTIPAAILLEQVSGVQPLPSWPAGLQSILDVASIGVVLNCGRRVGVFVISRLLVGMLQLTDVSQCCTGLSTLRLSPNGGLTFSATAIVGTVSPKVRLNRTSALTGAVVRIVRMSSNSSFNPCDISLIAQTEYFTALSTADMSSTLDLGPLFLKALNGNGSSFQMCVSLNSSFQLISNSFLQTVPPSAGTWVDAISTQTPNKNSQTITIWQTQGNVTWTVSGKFDPSTSVSLVLAFDSLCVTPALQLPLTYVSPTVASSTFDTEIFSSAMDVPLFPCYFAASNGVSLPLQLEMARNRTVMAKSLHLRSIQMLNPFSLRYNSASDTTVLLTDVSSPPITAISLFQLSSSPTTCSPFDESFVAFAVTTLTAGGQVWVTIPASATAIGSISTMTALRACATVSTTSVQQSVFIPVEMMFQVDSFGTPLSSAIELVVTFGCKTSGSYNATKGVSSVTSAVTAVLPSVNPNGLQVVPADSSIASSVLVYISPYAAQGVDAAVSLTVQLFQQLAASAPIVSFISSDNTTCTATTIVGLFVANRTVCTATPLTSIGASAPPVLPPGTSTFVLFCALVIPLALAAALYALNHGGSVEKPPPLRNSPMQLDQTGDRRRFMSPPPRIPEGHVEPEIKMLPLAGSTQVDVQDPLYDSDAEEHPPVTNETLASSAKHPLAEYVSGRTPKALPLTPATSPAFVAAQPASVEPALATQEQASAPAAPAAPPMTAIALAEAPRTPATPGLQQAARSSPTTNVQPLPAAIRSRGNSPSAPCTTEGNATAPATGLAPPPSVSRTLAPALRKEVTAPQKVGMPAPDLNQVPTGGATPRSPATPSAPADRRPVTPAVAQNQVGAPGAHAPSTTPLTPANCQVSSSVTIKIEGDDKDPLLDDDDDEIR